MLVSDAQYINENRKCIIDILCQSFDDNKSVNFVIKQDERRKDRLRFLIEYCFEKALNAGTIYLSEDKQCCAIVIDPERTKTTFKSVWWDIKLLTKSIGLSRAFKVMKREKLSESFNPKQPFVYLWYIGVAPASQGKGLGSVALHEIIVDQKLPIFLKTSTRRNFSFYEQNGFKMVGLINDIEYELRMYLSRKVKID